MCIDFKPRIARFFPAQLDPTLQRAFFKLDDVGCWGAITIGARSNVDRCFIVPGSEFPVVLDPSNGVVTSYQQLVANAIKVSVESPYVGALESPFIILPPYAEHCDDGFRWVGGVLDSQVDRIEANLDLHLYPNCPPFLPTKRAPYEQAVRLRNFGGTGGLASRTQRFPGWGRRVISLSVEAQDIAAGSLTWSFHGINRVFHPIATSDAFQQRAELQPDTVESANFDETYFFEGEFDYYELIVSETTALNDGVELDINFKAWD